MPINLEARASKGPGVPVRRKWWQFPDGIGKRNWRERIAWTRWRGPARYRIVVVVLWQTRRPAWMFAWARMVRLELVDGTKIGGDWFSDPQSTCRKHGSRSNARKAASAMIAKIPFELARHIAQVYYPKQS